MQVKDLMVSPVVATTVESDVAYVRELMERKGVSCIPIVGPAGEVKGIITTDDIIGLPDESLNATEVMARQVFAVAPTDSVQAAAQEMLSRNVHHLVVMDNGKLAGMLSSLDFVRMVAEEVPVASRP
ncbi:MAG: CBS domain-containing protein [Phaeodactylibacter sp.]|nr:CBS domain-containing protein [Phaeodactylibacter sp.]MCB9303334.1 CBS domain-containing protein [Lewinellaceae bacterium]HQU58218.1 CBS domain-containing protein [Saprospiraceae bacterium]